MSKAMEHPTKQTRRQRQRVAAEAREAARRRQAQRRTLAYTLGGAGLIAIVVLAVFAFMGGGGGDAGTDRVLPSRPDQVSSSGDPRAEPLAPGDLVPDFSAPGIGGGTVAWSDFAGDPVVMSVWAPWCPHCQVELPIVSRVMQDYPGVAFVTVVTSINDQPGPDAGVFLSDNGITAPTAIDDEVGTIAAALGIQGFPTLYFVDSDGSVVQELEGEVDEATLRELIGSLT
jgi:thiol-disulfide isomerase/thioredoxin